MIVNVRKILRETDLIIVNQMNIVSKRVVTRMLFVLKWKVMHIALVMLDFLVMVKNIVFQTVVLVIGQMSSLESAMMSMNA